MSEAASQAPALWKGALEEARSLFGVNLRRSDHRWNTDAHPDSVRHFRAGIGDDNPLFTDPAYGAAASHSAGLAPGCLLYTIDSTIVAPKLRGIQWMYGGTEWEWYHPVRHGDRLTNWVGDDGFVRAMAVKVQRPNIFGDTSWCRGQVVDKRVEDGVHLVDFEIYVENQFGEKTATGTATAALPVAARG